MGSYCHETPPRKDAAALPRASDREPDPDDGALHPDREGGDGEAQGDPGRRPRLAEHVALDGAAPSPGRRAARPRPARPRRRGAPPRPCARRARPPRGRSAPRTPRSRGGRGPAGRTGRGASAPTRRRRRAAPPPARRRRGSAPPPRRAAPARAPRRRAARRAARRRARPARVAGPTAKPTVSAPSGVARREERHDRPGDLLARGPLRLEVGVAADDLLGRVDPEGATGADHLGGGLGRVDAQRAPARRCAAASMAGEQREPLRPVEHVDLGGGRAEGLERAERRRGDVARPSPRRRASPRSAAAAAAARRGAGARRRAAPGRPPRRTAARRRGRRRAPPRRTAAGRGTAARPRTRQLSAASGIAARRDVVRAARTAASDGKRASISSADPSQTGSPVRCASAAGSGSSEKTRR